MLNGMRLCARRAGEWSVSNPLEKSNKWSRAPLIPLIFNTLFCILCVSNSWANNGTNPQSNGWVVYTQYPPQATALEACQVGVAHLAALGIDVAYAIDVGPLYPGIPNLAHFEHCDVYKSNGELASWSFNPSNNLFCLSGSTLQSNGQCGWTCPDPQIFVNGHCQAVKTNGLPSQCPAVGTKYPIHAGTGNKYWIETDFVSSISSGLEFTRQYNSQNSGAVSTLGAGWFHNYDRAITKDITLNGVNVVQMSRPNGKVFNFVVSENSYISQDPDITDRLEGLTDTSGNFSGYRYTVAADDAIETYTATGKLLSIKDRSGLIQQLTYSETSA